MAENKNRCGSHELQLKEWEKGVVCHVGLKIIELIKQNEVTCLSWRKLVSAKGKLRKFSGVHSSKFAK